MNLPLEDIEKTIKKKKESMFIQMHQGNKYVFLSTNTEDVEKHSLLVKEYLKQENIE